MTVRECARAQGFPDHWRFLSVNDKPNRIVDDVRVLSPPLPVPPVLTACDPAVPMPAIVQLFFLAHRARRRWANSNTARSATRCPSRSRARWGVRSARRCCGRGARRRPLRAMRWPCCVRGVRKSERARGAEKERTEVELRAARSGAIYPGFWTRGRGELNLSSNSSAKDEALSWIP